MKRIIISLLIFSCFLITAFFIKKQEKVPAISQIQDIQGFTRIDGGIFRMGSPKKESGRWSKGGAENIRNVVIKSFYIAQHEVTQKEYFSVMKDEMPLIENLDLPVHSISWFEAVEFCNKLSELHDLEPVYTISYKTKKGETFVNYEKETVKWNKTANGYRLPTSAEWECAIRAGTKTAYYTGETIYKSHENFNPSFPQFENIVIMPIGSYLPNPWGLYDMAGNVWEWCWDWYERIWTSTGRIIRGGSYSCPIEDLRSAALSCSPANSKSIYGGFRLARSVFP
jgi:formylglycine-generating enzyme required for sulfatase activity